MDKITSMQKVDGWTITFWSNDDEPRVGDTELATRLEYSMQPRDIRRLIERMIERGQLIRVNWQLATIYQTSRDGEQFAVTQAEFYLTEAQALKIIAKHDTENSDRLIDEVIQLFWQIKRDRLLAQTTPLSPAQVIEKHKASVLLALAREAEKGNLAAIQMFSAFQEELKPRAPAPPAPPQQSLPLPVDEEPELDLLPSEEPLYLRELRALVLKKRGWSGLSSALFQEVKGRVSAEQQEYLPSSLNTAGRMLKQVATSWAKQGIHILWRRHGSGNIIFINIDPSIYPPS